MQHDMPRRAAKKLQSGTRARTSPTSRAFSAHKHKPQCKFTVSAEIERRLCYLIGWRETCATCVRHLSIEIKKQESNLCQYLVQFHALPMCTGVRPRVCTFSHALCVVAQKGQPRQGGLGSPAPQAAAWATCSASARGPAATRPWPRRTAPGPSWPRHTAISMKRWYIVVNRVELCDAPC